MVVTDLGSVGILGVIRTEASQYLTRVEISSPLFFSARFLFLRSIPVIEIYVKDTVHSEYKQQSIMYTKDFFLVLGLQGKEEPILSMHKGG